MNSRNQFHQTGQARSGSPNVQHGPTTRQNALFRARRCRNRCIVETFRRPNILQLNIEGLTVSKMTVVHHLALQHEALVILLQETHCIHADRLVIPNYELAGSTFSRKHGLATFVHERLNWTLSGQSTSDSEIEWLTVDVGNYTIVNVYKPPTTRLQISDLPVFAH